MKIFSYFGVMNNASTKQSKLNFIAKIIFLKSLIGRAAISPNKKQFRRIFFMDLISYT